MPGSDPADESPGVIAPLSQRLRPQQSEVLKLVSDNSLACEKMNWTPKVSLDDGLRMSIDFVRANCDLFRSDGYVR